MLKLPPTLSRRLRQSITLIVLCLSLAACTASPAARGRLIIWHTWEEAESPIIEQLIEDFQRLHPDIQLSIERKDYETVLQEYAQASRAGLGPDVVIGLESVFAHVLYENDLITDLNQEAIDWSNFDSDILRAVERESDVRVGVPLNAYVSVLFYNPELIDQPPESLAELRALSEQGLNVGLPTSFFASYWGVTGTGGTVFEGDGLASQADPSISEWLDWLVRFQQTPGAVLSPDISALSDSFARGDIALLITNSLELATLEEAMGRELVGVATIPGYPDAQPFSTVEVIVVNSASVQTDAATLFVNFMSNEAQQRKLARSSSGRAPVNRTVNLNPTLFPRVSVILEQNQTAFVPTTRQDALINQLITEGNPIYQQVLEGLITPQKGAEEIVRSVIESDGGP